MPYKRKTTSTCAVYSCNNSFRSQNPKGISYYRMPKDKERLKKWLVAARRRDLEELTNFEEPQYFRKYYVCSDHFELSCFKNIKCLKIGLTTDSIPTLNLGNIPNLKKLDEEKSSLSGSISYRNCEICGKGRCKGEKFMAKFPLDENRCKQWVKVIGKENLVYVPIEKLHRLHYVCTLHFTPEDYQLNERQLKEDAVPSLYLNAKPLPDDMLVNFPCHLKQEEPSPCMDYSEEQISRYCDSAIMEYFGKQDRSRSTKMEEIVEEHQDQSTNYESTSLLSPLCAQNENWQTTGGKFVQQEQDSSSSTINEVENNLQSAFKQMDNFVQSNIKVEWDVPETTDSEIVQTNEPLIKSEIYSATELTIENEMFSTNEPTVKTETVSTDEPTFENMFISTNEQMIKTETVPTNETTIKTETLSTNEPTFETIFVSTNEPIIKKEKDDLIDPDYVNDDSNDDQSNDDDDEEVVHDNTRKDIIVRLNKLVHNGTWSLQQLTDQEATKLYRETRMSNNFKAAKFKCELCITQFTTREKFFKHIQLHKESDTRKVQCQICKKYLNRRNIYKHLVLHKTKYKCKKCSYVCYKFYQTKRHTNIHNIIERDGHYTCEYCNEKLESSVAMYEHVKMPCYKQYLCCKRSFLTSNGLFHHILRGHIHRLEEQCDPLKWKCTLCGAELLKKEILEHANGHNSGRVRCPHSCAIRFNGETELMRHIDLRHNEDDGFRKPEIQPLERVTNSHVPDKKSCVISPWTSVSLDGEQLSHAQAQNKSEDDHQQQEKRTVRRKKDSATLQREYRQRQTFEEAEKRKIAAAAYMREYRARKKPKKSSQKVRRDGENAIDLQTTDPIGGSSARETTSSEPNEKLNHKRALGARRAKDYRIRQRNRRTATAIAMNQSIVSDDQSQDEEPSLSILGF